MKTPAPEYVDRGHPGVWPNGELPAMRNAYDRMLAEQNAARPSTSKAGGAR
jgi:hypothetical protein